jgi:hypothetical protein
MWYPVALATVSQSRVMDAFPGFALTFCGIPKAPDDEATLDVELLDTNEDARLEEAGMEETLDAIEDVGMDEGVDEELLESSSDPPPQAIRPNNMQGRSACFNIVLPSINCQVLASTKPGFSQHRIRPQNS